VNRIGSIGRFASFLPGLLSAAPDRAAPTGKARARYRAALAAAVAGLVVPLAVALPATGPVAVAETRQPDMVTQWNLTMIAGL
jgi:hypothetical protein